VIEIPAIEIGPPENRAPLDDALRQLERYAWVAFTSANAVGAVRERLVALGLPLALGPRGPRLASVGPSTSEACRLAFPADAIGLQPESEFRAAGLLRAFAAGTTLAGARVLLPASSRARNELPGGLRDLGAVVDVVEAYRIGEPADLAEMVGRAFDPGFDAATFASPSAVEGFVGAAGERARGCAAVVIGPTTEAAARAAGLQVRAVARPSTSEGLVAALVGLFGGGEGAGTAGP
jgi:uroporphyrinogen III methyltransferase/synthase